MTTHDTRFFDFIHRPGNKATYSSENGKIRFLISTQCHAQDGILGREPASGDITWEYKAGEWIEDSVELLSEGDEEGFYPRLCLLALNGIELRTKDKTGALELAVLLRRIADDEKWFMEKSDDGKQNLQLTDKSRADLRALADRIKKTGKGALNPNVLPDVLQAIHDLAADETILGVLASGVIESVEKRKAKAKEFKALAEFSAEHLGYVYDRLSRADPTSSAWDVDAVGADYVTPFGAEGKKAAKWIREKSRERRNKWTGKQQTLLVEPTDWQKLWRLWFDVGAATTPVRYAKHLQRVLWCDVVRDRLEEQAEVPHPSLPVPIARAIMMTTAPDAVVRTRRNGVLVVEDIGAGWSQSLPPSALVKVAERTADSRAPAIAPLVAAALAIRAWERWQRGQRGAHVVTFPVGRDALRVELGVNCDVDNVIGALEWLRDGINWSGSQCVAGWHYENAKPGPGRPSKILAVEVGAPLAPQALAHALQQVGAKLPSALRWYAPVFNPAHAPRIGDKRTRQRQQALFGLGLGTFFIDKREEYRDRGAVQIIPAEWHRFCQRMALYHRTHASLADDVLNALCSTSAQGDLLEPRGPVLVETSPGSRFVKLGPDYAGAERMIIGAGERTREGRSRKERARRARKERARRAIRRPRRKH